MRRTALVACAAAVLLSGCAASEAEETRARDVVLTIRHSRFSASEIDVPVGVPVRYVVRNEDLIDHELIIGDDAAHARHESGKHGKHGEVPGEITVRAGDQASTVFTASASDEPLFFGCHLPGHWAYGMRGTVTPS